MKVSKNKIFISLILILFITVFGTSGYMLIEGWNLRDSLFMTIITITTVGYGEVHELSPNGEIFTIFLLIMGVGIIFYVLGLEAKVIVEGQLRDILGKRLLKKRIEDLKGHYIICGYGRMGKTVVKELASKGIELVAIEKSPPVTETEEVLLIEGNATSDEVLKAAAIEKAHGIVAVLPTDAENLFLVLTARELNPDIFIVARARDDGAEKKLIRAGADRVVSPYHTGSMKIAHLILKPGVVDFLEFATMDGNYELELKEIFVSDNSVYIDKTLEECAIGRDLRTIIVAIKKSDGSIQLNPSSGSLIERGDTLIALGDQSKLKVFEGLAHGNG